MRFPSLLVYVIVVLAAPPVFGEQPSDRIAARINDLWTVAHARTRLLHDPELAGLALDVDSQDGVVTLFGLVPDPSVQAAAAREVAKVDGVRRVENRLEVVPEREQPATRAHDRTLEGALRDGLAAQPERESREVDVAVCNGVARLRGSVVSDAAHRSAVEVAADTAGVRQIVDQLQVALEPARTAVGAEDATVTVTGTLEAAGRDSAGRATAVKITDASGGRFLIAQVGKGRELVGYVGQSATVTGRLLGAGERVLEVESFQLEG